MKKLKKIFICSFLCLFAVLALKLDAPAASAAPILNPPSDIEAYDELLIYKNDGKYLEYANSEKRNYYARTEIRYRVKGGEWVLWMPLYFENSEEVFSCGTMRWEELIDPVSYAVLKDYMLMPYTGVNGFNMDYTFEFQMRHCLIGVNGEKFYSDWSETGMFGNGNTNPYTVDKFNSAPIIDGTELKSQSVTDALGASFSFDFYMPDEEDMRALLILNGTIEGKIIILPQFRISYDGKTWTELGADDYSAYCYIMNSDVLCGYADFKYYTLSSEFRLSMRLAAFNNNTGIGEGTALFASDWSEPTEELSCEYVKESISTPVLRHAAVDDGMFTFESARMEEHYKYLTHFNKSKDIEIEYMVRFGNDGEWFYPDNAIKFNLSEDPVLRIPFPVVNGEDWDLQTQELYVQARYISLNEDTQINSEWSPKLWYQHPSFEKNLVTTVAVSKQTTAVSQFTPEEDTQGDDEGRDTAEDEKCDFCHICNKPLGVCVFGWLVLLAAAAATVVIVKKSKNKNKETIIKEDESDE